MSPYLWNETCRGRDFPGWQDMHLKAKVPVSGRGKKLDYMAIRETQIVL